MSHATIIAFAVSLVACGAPLATGRSCPGAQHPEVTSDVPGLDCAAVEWDFRVAHDLAILFGVGTPAEVEALIASTRVHVTPTDDPRAVSFDGKTLWLTRNGVNLALGLVQAAIYPSGWRWPHNPNAVALYVGNFACDLHPMVVGSPAAPTDGC